jgi:hypothetical protein
MPAPELPANGAVRVPANRVKRDADVLAYAGRYREKLSFAIDSTLALAATPAQRYGLQATKVACVSSVIATATGPDPAFAVRDLLVTTQLQRLIWDDPSRAAEFPLPAVETGRAALWRLESQVAGLAATVVGPQTLATLEAQIADWRAANPEQDYVAFVISSRPRLRSSSLAGSPMRGRAVSSPRRSRPRIRLP